MPLDHPSSAILHVCVTCRGGETTAEDVAKPGRRLFDRLRERAQRSVAVRPIECLARCNDGCTASISMAGKWSLLLGKLDETKADDLLSFAQTYRASISGTVMPSRRPASLSGMVLGRIPGIGQGEAP